VIDVTDGADIAMRLGALEFFFAHLALRSGSLQSFQCECQAYFA
jgi:hypothetical protein